MVLGSDPPTEILAPKKLVETLPLNSSRSATCPEVTVCSFLTDAGLCCLLVVSYTALASWKCLILCSRSSEPWQKQGKETKLVVKRIAKVEPQSAKSILFSWFNSEKYFHHQFL